jgi:hypothetical protein
MFAVAGGILLALAIICGIAAFLGGLQKGAAPRDKALALGCLFFGVLPFLGLMIFLVVGTITQSSEAGTAAAVVAIVIIAVCALIAAR